MDIVSIIMNFPTSPKIADNMEDLPDPTSPAIPVKLPF